MQFTEQGRPGHQLPFLLLFCFFCFLTCSQTPPQKLFCCTRARARTSLYFYCFTSHASSRAPRRKTGWYRKSFVSIIYKNISKTYTFNFSSIRSSIILPEHQSSSFVNSRRFISSFSQDRSRSF